MSNKSAEIRERIRAIVGLRNATLFAAEVVKVSGNTCEVKVGELAIEGVRLTATSEDKEDNSVIIKPAEGSMVLVGDLGNGELRDLAVVQWGEVEDVTYHGGKNSGMVKVNAMAAWMDKVYADLQTLKTSLATWAVAGNGAPLALVFVPTTPKPMASDFENEKIKH